MTTNIQPGGGIPRPIPTAVLRRLAQAVNGRQTGETYYLVVADQSPHDVVDVRVVSGDEAPPAPREGATAYGPFATVDEPVDRSQVARVEQVVARVRRADGTQEDIAFDGGTCDALFWSLEAVDKFLVPYYAATESFERAQAARSDFKTTGWVLGPHKWWSNMATPPFGGA